MANIVEGRSIFMSNCGMRSHFGYDRDDVIAKDVIVYGRNKRVEVEVVVDYFARTSVTFQDSSIRSRPVYTTRVLWVHMTHIDGHDWWQWLNQKLADGNFGFFVLSSIACAMPSTYVVAFAERLSSSPVVQVQRMNNDEGCVVVGTFGRFRCSLRDLGLAHPYSLRFGLHLWRA